MYSVLWIFIFPLLNYSYTTQELYSVCCKQGATRPKHSVCAVPEGPIYGSWMSFMMGPQLQTLGISGASLIRRPKGPHIAKLLYNVGPKQVFSFILAIRFLHLCWSLFAWRDPGDHGYAAEVAFVFAAAAASSLCVRSPWHLEHHCNRKNARKRPFSFPLQWTFNWVHS